MELSFEIARASHEAQEHYRKLIADGQSPRFAEMCALQAAPAVHGTNDNWMRGRRDGNWMDSLPKKQAQWMLREAKAAGIDPTGKYYMSGIADSRAHLDPEAWVSGKDDVLRVAKKRRLEVKGQINYTPPEGVEPPKRTKGLNPKLVKELAKREAASEPGLSRQAAEQRIREKHTPHWHRKKS
jgi:hypothetical protein